MYEMNEGTDNAESSTDNIKTFATSVFLPFLLFIPFKMGKQINFEKTLKSTSKILNG